MNKKEILQELYPYGAVEPNNHNDLLDKTLSILNGNNLDIKTNSKFLTSEMCHKTISFYKEILT